MGKFFFGKPLIRDIFLLSTNATNHIEKCERTCRVRCEGGGRA